MANPFVASSRALINDGSSSYHGAEFELRRRFADGFSFQANYTFGRSLADFDGDENTLVNATRASSIRNGRYSRSEIMPRHLFKMNWIYELPFGKGKPFLTGNRFASRLLGGWQFGGIVNFRSGRPLSIFSNTGTFHRNAISDDNTVDLASEVDGECIRDLTGRQDLNGGIFWIHPNTSAFLQGESNCASASGSQCLFELPRPGQLGQLGQTIIFGPRRFLMDFNVARRFDISEGKYVEFRWEVFNAFRAFS